MIDFKKYKFHPVIDLPKDFEVYDFSQGYDPNRKPAKPFGIGKYNEKRKSMYTAPLFGGVRDIHVGIDIAAPIHTPVYNFFDGEIFLFGYNSAPGDYGNTIITKHKIDNTPLFALYGHLSANSLAGKSVGQKFRAGEQIATVGDKHENGGWNPHLHFQLSYREPSNCDMPGVVSDDQHQEALTIYPDPQLVLGKLY